MLNRNEGRQSEGGRGLTAGFWLTSIACFCGLIAFTVYRWGGAATSHAVAILGIVVGYILLSAPAWLIGDALRRYAMPTFYYSQDFFAAIRNRIFWKVGPQIFGVLGVAFVAGVGIYLLSADMPDAQAAAAVGTANATSTANAHSPRDQPTRSLTPSTPVVQSVAAPSSPPVQERPYQTAQTEPTNIERMPNTSTTPESPKSEVAAPSFDCGKATTLVENTICGDGKLAQLDVLLAGSYSSMMSSDIGDGARAALKADQRAWLSRRNQCSSKSCLAEIYETRIDEVCDIPVLSGVHPSCGR